MKHINISSFYLDQRRIERTLLPELVSGMPNLLLCRKGNLHVHVFNAALLFNSYILIIMKAVLFAFGITA
jgi:hypothetical protein